MRIDWDNGAANAGVFPAIDNGLEIRVVIDIEGKSLLGPLTPFAAKVTQQVGTFRKITRVVGQCILR